MTTIALLGTGAMGTPMGHSLLRAGFALTVWNRTAARTAELVAAGARAEADPSDAVRDAEVVVIMLDRGETVTGVLFGATADVGPGALATSGTTVDADPGDAGPVDRDSDVGVGVGVGVGVAAALNRGATVVDMSSIPPDTARAHALRLGEFGVSHLDAPVSGGTAGAAEGTLAIMVGGDRRTFDRAEPVLRALGRPVLVGTSGAGQWAKLANQIIVGAGLAAIAEAMTLVAASGADPALARAAMAGGFADGPLLQLHGDRMLRRDFAPRGSVDLQLKDLDTALASASDHGVELPLTATAAALYRRVITLVGPDVDQSAILLAVERGGDLV